MGDFVPDFDPEEYDCFATITTSSAPLHNSNIPKISQSQDEDASLLELLWNQGPVVRPLESGQFRETPERREPGGGGGGCGDVGSSSEAANQLFMEEDEMAMWLHHYQDAGAAGESQGGGGGGGGGSSGGGGGDLYSEMLEPSSRASSCSQVAEATGAAAERKQGSSSVVDMVVGKVFDAGSVKASVGCSSAHVSERKRKAETGKDIEYHSEDVEIESGNKRKDVRQPTSTRTRAAEVHNLSERRRRDRINEKLRTLQELIPRCNKSDKASMLDDAIEYLKSLQLQVQIMSSMQYNMGQMMFPDTQRYMQTMGFMGMGMGMTSGGMQRPVMPFGLNLPYPPVFGQSPANLPPRLIRSFHPANVAIPDQVRLEASNQQDPASSSIYMMGPNIVQIPNFADRYHHYAPLPHLQVSSQGQTMDEPGTSKKTDNTKKSTGSYVEIKNSISGIQPQFSKCADGLQVEMINSMG